jgi:hypothetical protein
LSSPSLPDASAKNNVYYVFKLLIFFNQDTNIVEMLTKTLTGEAAKPEVFRQEMKTYVIAVKL